MTAEIFLVRFHRNSEEHSNKKEKCKIDAMTTVNKMATPVCFSDFVSPTNVFFL